MMLSHSKLPTRITPVSGMPCNIYRLKMKVDGHVGRGRKKKVRRNSVIWINWVRIHIWWMLEMDGKNVHTVPTHISEIREMMMLKDIKS